MYVTAGQLELKVQISKSGQKSSTCV